MYYPYCRGKQFELIAIRESAALIARSNFTPIIEPVRESLDGLDRTLNALEKENAKTIVVLNPRHGDYKESGDHITTFLADHLSSSPTVSPGILLTSEMTIEQVCEQIEICKSGERQTPVSLIHSGFTEAHRLASLTEEHSPIQHIFLDSHTNRSYRNHFSQVPRVLIRDGFEQMRNADYPRVQLFSDLHSTYRQEGVDGYGDFLTIGDNYSEGGGPAYAVAIHLTFIDEAQDDMMFVYHFKSFTNDTPTDPAGKFAQALNELIGTLNSGQSRLLETSAIQEFRTLHERQHFPGLGYVKKLSIKHHLETLSAYHSPQNER